jgi:hypothetical protein
MKPILIIFVVSTALYIIIMMRLEKKQGSKIRISGNDMRREISKLFKA